jgi:hypothetical protein
LVRETTSFPSPHRSTPPFKRKLEREEICARNHTLPSFPLIGPILAMLFCPVPEMRFWPNQTHRNPTTPTETRNCTPSNRNSAIATQQSQPSNRERKRVAKRSPPASFPNSSQAHALHTHYMALRYMTNSLSFRSRMFNQADLEAVNDLRELISVDLEWDST